MEHVNDVLRENRPPLTAAEIDAAGEADIAVGCAFAAGPNFAAFKFRFADGGTRLVLVHPQLASYIVRSLAPLVAGTDEDNPPYDDATH